MTNTQLNYQISSAFSRGFAFLAVRLFISSRIEIYIKHMIVRVVCENLIICLNNLHVLLILTISSTESIEVIQERELLELTLCWPCRSAIF